MSSLAPKVTKWILKGTDETASVNIYSAFWLGCRYFNQPERCSLYKFDSLFLFRKNKGVK